MTSLISASNGTDCREAAQRLAGLAAFLPEFEREGFVFGQWEGGEIVPGGGVMQMPYYSLSEAGMAIYQAVYDLGWVALDFNWTEWCRTPEGTRLLGDPAVLATASVEDLTRVITTCIRRDRFCEGALSGDFDDGRLLAILRRAAALRDELRIRTGSPHAMIEALKPYPKYKDSGAPWLGEVPEHWEVERAKWRFRFHKRLNTDGQVNNILSLTLRGVVNNDPDEPEGLVPKDYRTYQIFMKDDLVFKLIDLENLRTSRVGLVHEDGIMSPAYLRLSSLGPCNIKYYYHQFYDLYQRGIYNQLGAGVRSTLSQGELLNLTLLVPSSEEQGAIVRYLEVADRRIQKYIRVKQRLIALLNEQKQAIIQRAVTQGLNPDAPKKPSGIPWLGDIPAHWEVTRLKMLYREVDARSKTGEELLLSLRMYRGLVPHEEVSEKPISAAQLVGYKKVAPSQLVMNRMRAAIGMFAVAPIHGLVSPDYAVFQRLAEFCDDYYMYLFRSPTMCSVFRLESRGLGTGSSGFLRLYSEDFLSLPVPRPPITEQRDILEYISAATTTLQETVNRTTREIDLLREYRTRLIADVVTGKLDVRAAASKMAEVEVGESLSEVGPEEEIEEIEALANA